MERCGHFFVPHTYAERCEKLRAKHKQCHDCAHSYTDFPVAFPKFTHTISPFSPSVQHGAKQGVKMAVKRLRLCEVLRLWRKVKLDFFRFLLIGKIPQRFPSLGKLRGNVYGLFIFEIHRCNSNDYLVIYSAVPNMKDCWRIVIIFRLREAYIICSRRKRIVLKKRVLSKDKTLFWWAIRDSNLGPTGYEPVALTNWANGPTIYRSLKSIAQTAYNCKT